MSSVSEVLPEVPWLQPALDDKSTSSGSISRKLIDEGYQVGDRAIRHWREVHSTTPCQNTGSLKTTITNDGVEFSGLTSTGAPDDNSYDAIFKLNGLDPSEYRLINDKLVVKSWQVGDEWRFSYAGSFERVTGDDLERAKFLASTIPPVPAESTALSYVGDPLVVNLADLQIGKVDILGDTPALISRFESALRQVVNIAAETFPQEIVIADVGDCIENVANHTSVSQTASNDLPVAEQVRVAQKLIIQTIISLYRYTEHVTVLGVPSNHGAERLGNGKQNGHGDWGVSNIKGVRDAFKLLGDDYQKVSFKLPATDYDMSVAHTVEGLPIVWTHGHVAGSVTKMPQWVANQAATPSNIYSSAKVVVHGHWHHLSFASSRGRSIIGCPTLDNGSSWFNQSDGEWSEPGILIFRVHDGRLHGLQLIQ